MKNLILTITIALTASLSFCQTNGGFYQSSSKEIGSVTLAFEKYVMNNRIIIDNDTTYKMTIKDVQYTHIYVYEDFYYDNHNELYAIMLECMTKGKKYSFTDVKGNNVIIVGSKAFGKPLISIYVNGRRSTSINMKNLYKLFGR